MLLVLQVREKGPASFSGAYLDVFLVCTGTPMPQEHRANEQNALALLSTARKGEGSRYITLGRAIFETDIAFQEVCAALIDIKFMYHDTG